MFERYLTKNYYYEDRCIFKNTGVSVTGNFILNDICVIFSISRPIGREAIDRWLMDHGLQHDEIKLFFPKLEAEFLIEENQYFFGITEYKRTNGEQEYITIDNQRMFGRYNGPIVDLVLCANNNDPLLMNKLLEYPNIFLESKFNLIIRNSEIQFESEFLGCFISNIEHQIVDGDEFGKLLLTIKCDR